MWWKIKYRLKQLFCKHEWEERIGYCSCQGCAWYEDSGLIVCKGCDYCKFCKHCGKEYKL